MRIATFLLFGMFAMVAFGQAGIPPDNAKLTELFKVDQIARQGKNIDWAKLRVEDEGRRQELHKMIDAGELRTAVDYFHAALIYQHGQNADDFLLAHVLAVDSMGLGNKDARWLAAATLDRYLLTISQPQIFGTQFQSEPGKSIAWSQRTMNSSLLSDGMRTALCIVPIAEQQKILDEVNRGRPFRSTNAAGGTNPADCK